MGMVSPSSVGTTLTRSTAVRRTRVQRRIVFLWMLRRRTVLQVRLTLLWNLAVLVL